MEAHFLMQLDGNCEPPKGAPAKASRVITRSADNRFIGQIPLH
jgi:hypothetical protein